MRSEGLEIHVAMVSPNRETRKAHAREAPAAAPISPPARSAQQPHAVNGTAVRNRLVLGVGAGYHEAQFRWLGAEYRTRGARLDEYILAMRELWTAPEPRFQGKHVAFSDLVFAPRPARPAGPPIVIGGNSPAALRRAATLADGWHPVGLTPAQFADGMNAIRALSNGRPVEGSLRIRTLVDRTLDAKPGGESATQMSLNGSPAELRARIEEYRTAGVEHLVLYFEADDIETTVRDMRRFAAEVRPAFH